MRTARAIQPARLFALHCGQRPQRTCAARRLFSGIAVAAVLMTLENSSLAADATMVVVVGASGTEEYAETFSQWAADWQRAAEEGGAVWQRVGEGEESAETDRDRLLQILEHERSETLKPFWLILIGHGTFDGQQAKFNLRGPDISAQELAKALEGVNRPLVIVNASSASGPFVNALSAAGRVIVTATKNGYELNYSRFGGYMAAAIRDPRSDLDKDDQVSVLEAFLAASAQVAEYYDSEGRLATEHAILDDNGDRLGTPADFFQGVRAMRAAQDGHDVDGTLALRTVLVPSMLEQQIPEDLRTQRDALEQQLEQLRQRKADLEPPEYDRQLEEILLRIAAIYAQSEATAAP